ncbi:hypothetical protein G7Z17_g4114 [Cylindrodendrum hubeiense]|uniref:Hydantoinase A/oxoprolinase domain-containing protein n=1 Tax=Cylindrodendrum hubeiense TaxID=595255 RepID=A0A9P5HEI4_9HYPO|nr:hypothetical protein G7Z17_g4114 [Cylindrodendrum hubeiense]
MAITSGKELYRIGVDVVDGRTIKDIRVDEVTAHAHEIRQRKIPTVVIVGIFSPLDTADISQESQVKQILQQEIPGIDVVCSRDIGRIGFVERENTAILNGSILRFARRTIQGFRRAISELGLNCPLYLTQNDGTIIEAEAAALAPIKTFSSGATNSLTGAIFLSGIHEAGSNIDLQNSQVIMVDIGGTTSDFAALSPSGFPRQASATATVAGIRTAFSMPEVISIGLGGGSLVQVDDTGHVSVGPISVGHRLRTESLCYGGTKFTATDIVVAQNLHGDSLPSGKVDVAPEIVRKATHQIAAQLERCIDTMKTSDADVMLLLVGGGSIIQGAELRNVSGDVDRIVIPEGRSHAAIVEDLKAEAIKLAHHNGARVGSVEVMELELIPLQYATNDAVRVIAKATGELEWKLSTTTSPSETATPIIDFVEFNEVEDGPADCNGVHIPSKELTSSFDLDTYVPEVSDATGEWFVSEIDLEFIGEGCGILGTGGGGSVHSALLHSLETLRTTPPKRMRIIEAGSLPPKSNVAMIAFAGAPSVSNERLIGGNELASASQELARFLGLQGYEAMMAAEIGGSNGMRTFASAANMDLPIVDADTMGRAFPKVDMALPYVFGQASPAPAVLSDARGNVQVIARVEDSHRFESIIRSACVELGLFAALVIPGGRLLYTGKVIDIRREVKGGWTIGTATLEPFDDEECDTRQTTSRQLILTYQFSSALLQDEAQTTPSEILCITPDLITVIDSHSGTALATHELRYGLRVAVIAMPAHPLWMTKAGLEAGGPQAFGLDHAYQPLDRKVLCDRTLPTCHRCAASGRDCSGYELRLSWPKAGDKRRALIGPDTPGTNSLGNPADLLFINASFWDVEMHRDKLLSKSQYQRAIAQRSSQATRLHHMRELAQPVLDTPVSWMPLNLSDLDKGLLQYFVSVASFSLPSFGLDASMIRHAIIRMALSGNTPATTAVLKSALALASLYRDGPRNRAALLKVSALRALSASANTKFGSAECIQHVAAGMLLCSFEVQQASETSSHWLWYICGSKDIIKTAKLEDSAHNSDFTALIGWVHYYDVLVRFSLRYWQILHDIDNIQSDDPNFQNFSPTVCSRSRAANLVGTSHTILDLLSEICDAILAPSDPEYYSDEYRQYLDVLEWRLRNIQIEDPGTTSDTSEADTAKATKLYQLAALTYVTRSSEKSADQSEKVREWIKEAFDILSHLNVCKAPFPLFVFGCEAGNDELRAIILKVISKTENVAHIQSLERVKSMLEFIWVQNDLVDVHMDYTDQLGRIFGSSDILPAMV